jgi:hypothetical protein
LKTDENIPAVSSKQKQLGEKTKKIWTVDSHEKEDQDPDPYPDPYQNDMDPQHCFTVSDFIRSLPHHLSPTSIPFSWKKGEHAQNLEKVALHLLCKIGLSVCKIWVFFAHPHPHLILSDPSG